MSNKNTSASQSSNKKNVVTIVIVLVCVAAVAGAKYLKDAGNLAKLKISQAKFTGDENAPIKITEFVDFQCPACANGAKTLKQYRTDHPHKIRLELKYFPLKMHQHALVIARYAECAARQDKFWPFTEIVFDRQDQWKSLFDAHSAFDGFAGEAGMNAARLESCLKDPSVDELIEKNKQEGVSLGVESTPTYFINGVLTVGTKNLEFELGKLISAQKN